MHSIEDIIADAQSAVAASLRNAYDAGREHQSSEMRDKFVAFFEGVIGPFSKAPAEPPVEASAEPAPAPAPAEAAAEAPPEAVAAEPVAEAVAEAAAETPTEAAAEAAPAA
jgi:hypothetical protein